MGCTASDQVEGGSISVGGAKRQPKNIPAKSVLNSKGTREIVETIFRWWSNDTIEKMVSHFVALSYPKNTQLSTQGTPGCYFIVLSGKVDILLDSTVFCRKSQGDAFSLGTMIAKTGAIKVKRRIVAQVIEDCAVLALTAPALEQFGAENPNLKEEAIAQLGADPISVLETYDMVKNADDGVILSYIMRLRALNLGQMLFDEGSLGRELYIVAQGQCAAVSRVALEETNMSFTDETDTLRLFSAGEFFGEIALSFAIPRTTAIYATTKKTLCLELDKYAYEKFCLVVGGAHLQRVQARIAQSTAEQFQKYKCPFFDAIPQKTFPELAALCQIDIHPPGTIIFKQGDNADSFYMIVFGTCAVNVETDGVSRSICTMGRGKYFGEIALVKEAIRTATVVTTERAVIMSVKKDNFRQFMDTIPEAAADFRIKLARYEVDLPSVLSYSKGVEIFTKHLEREFSQENIMFWKACRAYRALEEDWKEHLPHRGSAVLSKLDLRVRMPGAITVDMEAFESFELYRTAVARRIYDTFISEHGRHQVNISSISRQQVEDRLQSQVLDERSYAEAEQAVLSLMSKDPFSRFKQSDLFQELIGDDSRMEEQGQVLKNKQNDDGKQRKVQSGGSRGEEDGSIGSQAWLV